MASPSMDKSERAPTASLQSTIRHAPDNSLQGRRPIPNSAATSNGAPPPPPPVPNLRKIPSSSNLTTSGALSASQVIALARDAMRNALEIENQAAEGSGLKTGVTVDLSRKNIQKLPEEVVDIVKVELERLALSHNQLSTLPARFSECTSLRYLNVRGNQLKEFPMAICDLTSLEILDLGRNQLRALPFEISKLSSLKVLSIPKNQIRELPLSLADMGSLQVLKFEGNPVSFPPRDAMQVQAASPPDGVARDSEVTEIAVTAQIKKFLKHYAVNGRADSDSPADDFSEPEAPRFPLKRVASGRFPVKVAGAGLPDIRSPNLGSRAPPIPARSHYRGLSQQNPALRRPSVMPLTIGNVNNERLRSNSESLLRSERVESRNRRMGVISKRPSELNTLNEMEANNRFSHYRGLSHGSAMTGNPVNTTQPAPATGEGNLHRPVYVRRLSVLPERRRESKIFDPVIEAAKGILYSVFQIHPMIQMLMTLTSDGSAKRSSLEIVFYNTNSHVEELEQEIQKYDTALVEDEGYASHENEHVHRACQTLVSAYGHICTLLAESIDTLVDNGDPRYIRTLLMLLYNSIMEIRVTLSSASHDVESNPSFNRDLFSGGDTIKPQSRESSVVPAVDRAGPTRSRNGTVVHNPVNLRVATDMPIPTVSDQSHPSLTSATPRSGESFVSASSRLLDGEFSEEDSQFEKVYLSLQKSADIILHTLPNFLVQLRGGLRNAMQKRAPQGLVHNWKTLIAMCDTTTQQTQIMKGRLSTIKLKDPSTRSQAHFWNLCNNFIASWASTALRIKDAFSTVPLPPDTRARLRPIQQSIKETSNIIMQSPWHHMFRPMGENDNTSSPFVSQTLLPSQVPITPQSAALGPAMQATVQKSPHGSNTSFAAAFHGNVFDRADALMANPGISMSRSGNGTMIRGHSNFNSLSSISSMSSDGTSSTPASAMSPSTNGAMGSNGLRINGVKPPF